MSIYGKYFRKYKYPFLVAVLCVALEGVCDLLGPTLMSNIINKGIEKQMMSEVYRWGGLMLLVTLFGAFFAVTRNIFASKTSQRMGADLRYDLFKKIISFSEEGSDKIESGSLITRMTNDTAQVIQFVNGIMRIFLKAPITCIGSIIFASILNFRLSLIIYGVVAAVAVLITISMKLSYPRFSKLQAARDKMNIVVQEYLIGVRVVKAFGTYKEETEKFHDTNDSLMKRSVSSQMVITLISPIINLTVGIGTVAVVYLGSILFPMQLAEPGDITAFIIYMAQILSSLIMITNVFNVFVRTKASTARIKEVLDSSEDFSETGEKKKITGDIEFRNVTFAYPAGSGVPAVRNLSLVIEHGQNLAIIGPTGSGKSTVAWLLLRFYDVDNGQILINGQDIRQLNVKSLRNQIALVPQNPMLFSGTISENIKWGDKQATNDSIDQVVKKAEAGFIYNMPNQYDSILGSSGVNISGGQKQRISIARGLIKDSPILILDDATSALDAVTESKVRQNLKSDQMERTVITITQRIGTAMSSDKILVMDNGNSVGFGTHDELMKECPMYKDIYKLQIEGSKEA